MKTPPFSLFFPALRRQENQKQKTVSVLPSEQNGLRKPSDLMLDKLHTTLRDKKGLPFGHLERTYLTELERLLTVFQGLT